MSGRVCLLCEKPLGRIWLGAGEDFCSREHRNQYRLRRGMDRLLEANKVASLMRRRENPKPIPVFREIAESGLPRHGYFDIPFSAHDGEALERRGWNLEGGMRQVAGMTGAAASFGDTQPERQEPRIRAQRARAQRLPPPLAAEAPRLAGQPRPAALPGSRKLPYARVRAAGPAVSKRYGTDGKPGRRDAGIVWKSALPLQLDAGRSREATFRPYREPHGWRASKIAGPSGYSLRVSLGAGFRVQATRLRTSRLNLPQPAVPEAREPRNLPADLYEGRREPLWETGPTAVRTGQAIPQLQWEQPAVRMEWPGMLSPHSGRPLEGTLLEVRPLPGAFSGFPPAFPPPTPHGGRDQASLRRLRLHLVGDPPAARVQLVSLGSVDGVDSRPGAPHESRTSLEERFDSGWKNWMGDFATWTVDAAGARTGSLALFTPSMEWKDYELEFFTRIENRSITWVYRAVSLNDYYMATLTALPGKGYTLTRRTVVRGKPGAALTAPFTILPNPKSAYLIRLRIAGNQFSLTIDGQKVETWTDNRFSIGGVGFLGAADDRARIYWARFYPGSGKESQRK